MHTDEAIRQGLTALCGEAVYDAAGELNRAALAARIFADPAMLARVNALVHPRVEADFLAWAERLRGGVVALESAILFSSGLSRTMDCVIRVIAPEEVRIRRVLARNNCSRQQVLARMRNQQHEDGEADFLLVNDGKADVDEQLQEVMDAIVPSKAPNYVILSEVEGSYASRMASPAGCVRFLDYAQNEI